MGSTGMEKMKSSELVTGWDLPFVFSSVLFVPWSPYPVTPEGGSDCKFPSLKPLYF